MGTTTISLSDHEDRPASQARNAPDAQALRRKNQFMALALASVTATLLIAVFCFVYLLRYVVGFNALPGL